jgi:signal transduction histidine kinase
MARVLNTVLARFVIAALAIQLVLAPLLVLGVLKIVRDSEIDLFVNDVRAYSRFLGDLLEFELPRATDDELVDLLDSIVLSHETVYAELHGPNMQLRSSLLSDEAPNYEEDFSFGEHSDNIYFLSIPLNDPADRGVILRLGFDEKQIGESLGGARARVLWTLSGFVVVSLAAVIILGVLLVRPLRDLQRESRAVASGKYDEHFGVTTNLAEIRELAADLEDMRSKLVRANERLSREIAERREAEEARAGLERKLRHVQKVETVGTLAGGIAHEFNNLLVPIKLYTELTIDELPLDSAVRGDLKRVLAAVTRAKNLVQKILTFSRQSQPERYGSIELVPIVEDALTLARDLFPATIRLESKLGARGVKIVGDETQLHQLVMNLLNNAFQAIGTGAGTIAVEVSLRSLAESAIPPRTNLAPGEYVVISVHDSGHGIDPLTLERVFEPFFTTRGQGEGTGLGLSVAHGIASSHGGAIGVESELNRGTTFSVYLPVVNKANTHLSALGLTNILYVAAPGAETENRVAAAALGARTRAVGSRAELLELLALEENVDLLILDLSADHFWESLDPQDLPRRRATDACVLLLGPLKPKWETALQSWSHARQLLAPVDAATISAAVQGMLAERPRRLQERPTYDTSVGDRRRARRS